MRDGEGKHLIYCLLAQLWLNQQRYLQTRGNDHHHRFDAVMTALDNFHAAGRALDWPRLYPSPILGEYQELDAILLHWQVRSWSMVHRHGDYVVQLTLNQATATNLLVGLTTDEHEVIDWLAGVYTNPSLALHPVP